MAEVPKPSHKESQFTRRSEVIRNVGLLTAVGGLLMPILLLPGLLLAAAGEAGRRVSKKETVVFKATPKTA